MTKERPDYEGAPNPLQLVDLFPEAVVSPLGLPKQRVGSGVERKLLSQLRTMTTLRMCMCATSRART